MSLIFRGVWLVRSSSTEAHESQNVPNGSRITGLLNEVCYV